MKEDPSESPEMEETESKQNSTEASKAKNDKPLREVLKEETTLTPARVIITTLTAVSMAIISTKLTSVVNGMVLAGSIAVISAVVSEAYRVVTTLTTHGMNKAVAPIEKKNLKDREREKAAETEPIDEPKKSPIEPLREYFARRKNMQMIALFSATAILTIGTSFIVTKSLETPSHVSNNYPTQVKAEQLSEDEKQKIIDEAVAESTESPTTQTSQSPGATPSPSKDEPEPADEKNETSGPTPSDTSDSDVESLKQRIDDLEKTLQDIQEDRDTAPQEIPQEKAETTPEPEPETTTETKTEDDTSTVTPEVTEEEVEELREEIDELKKQLEDQEGGDSTPEESSPSTEPRTESGSTPTDTESPETSPSPNPENTQSDGGG